MYLFIYLYVHLSIILYICESIYQAIKQSRSVSILTLSHSRRNLQDGHLRQHSLWCILVLTRACVFLPLRRRSAARRLSLARAALTSFTDSALLYSMSVYSSGQISVLFSHISGVFLLKSLCPMDHWGWVNLKAGLFASRYINFVFGIVCRSRKSAWS